METDYVCWPLALPLFIECQNVRRQDDTKLPKCPSTKVSVEHPAGDVDDLHWRWLTAALVQKSRICRRLSTRQSANAWESVPGQDLNDATQTIMCPDCGL